MITSGMVLNEADRYAMGTNKEDKEQRDTSSKPGQLSRLIMWTIQGYRDASELLLRCWHRGRLRCSLVLFIFVLLFRNVTYTIGYLNKQFPYRTWTDRYSRCSMPFSFSSLFDFSCCLLVTSA
jgi:hypothetical protein